MFINHSSKEVTAKIVYYGPGLSGKTTCLQYIFSVTNPKTRGELISIETEIERTLFFDLLPINVGLVKGYQTKFQLYTVPGQVFYDSTRKLVLKGADGIVFVADSQRIMEEPNVDSLENLKMNLTAHRLDIQDIPMVFQYNKQDLGNILSIDELNKALNPRNYHCFGSIATKGHGVIEALREISSQILKKIKFLLDHTEDPHAAMPQVQFDTNKRHKIIDKEHLPLKKIHAESLDNFDQRLLPEEMKRESLEHLFDRFPEDELKVETVEEIEELQDIVIDEEPAALEPLLDLEEIEGAEDDKKSEQPQRADGVETVEIFGTPGIDKIEDTDQDPLGKTVLEVDVDTTEYLTMEELVEKELEKEKGRKKKKETEIEEDSEPFKDLQDLRLDLDEEANVTRIELGDDQEDVQELKDIGELLENGTPIKEPVPGPKETNDNKEAEPFKLEEIKEEEEEELEIELSEAVLKEPHIPGIKIPKEPQEVKPVKPSKEIKELEELKKSLQREEIKSKKAPTITKGFDLFDRLKDKTRLTIIKEVHLTSKDSDTQLLIDIKDKDSNLLESLKVDITPEIKKVTLIIDVKK